MAQETKDKFSSELRKVYTVRPGTLNFGREYEFKVATLLSLRCIAEGFEDFWLAANADGMGAFDDVVLHIRQPNKETVTYMLQLKHQTNPKNIAQKEYLSPKGDFSLSKYFKDINTLHESLRSCSDKEGVVRDLNKSNKIYFVLFTNRGVNECKFLDKSDDPLLLLNTSDAKAVPYKFINTILTDGTSLNIANRHNNLYLLQNQVDIKCIDTKIAGIIQKMFKIQTSEVIAENFVKFITSWATGALDGHFCLKREDILYKLSELVLSQYELELKQFIYYDCETKRIWNDVVANKAITVVTSSEAVRNFLMQYIGSEIIKYGQFAKGWGDKFSEKQQKAFHQKNPSLKAYILESVGNWGKMNLLDVYKSSWRMGYLPLLLVIQNAQDYKIILNTLQMSNYSYRVVLINDGTLLPQRKRGEARLETMADVDEENTAKLLRQPVHIQGRPGITLDDLLKEDLHQFITSCDIINILLGDFNIGNTLTPLPEYFINRTIIKTVLSYEILQRYTDDIFIIITNSKNLVDYPTHTFDNLDLNNGIILTKDAPTAEQVQKLKPTKNPIHILANYDENYLEWKWSHGSVQTIQDFQVKLELELKSEGFKKLWNTITLVSAPPGMGKTVLIDYLTHQAPTNVWVLRIDLNYHQTYFRHDNCKNPNTEASKHLKYFFEAIHGSEDENKDLNRVIFQKHLNNKNVLVLIDGFDEVSVSYKVEVTNIARSLNAGGYNICITTRPVMDSYLQEVFKVASVTLKRFSLHDQRQFLRAYFKDPPLSSEGFVEKLLNAARRNLNDADAEFTSIPLQTKLLADVFSAVSFNENFDLLYLYQNFIDNKIKILVGKFGETGNDLHEMVKEHQYLFALKLIFPMDSFMEMKTMKKLYEFYKNQPKRIQLLQRQGIIMLDDGLNITCIHRTFAEFLSAEWLSINVNSSDNQIKELVCNLIKQRFTRNYKFLFNVFDRILAKDCKLHLAVINKQIEMAINLINLNPDCVEVVDSAGRSALHLIALHGFQYPLPYLLPSPSSIINNPGRMAHVVEMILKVRSINWTDVMGYTPLDYAIANCSLKIADQLNGKRYSVINAYVNLAFETCYLKYCLNYHPDLFHTLLFYFVSRNLLLNNTHRNTTINSYTKQCYTCYHYEQCLDEYRNKNVLEFLQNEVRPDAYYSDIRYAIAFGARTNVQQLLYAGVDVNKQDVNRCTPIHYAALHGRAEIMQILLQNGAVVNIKNEDDNTPLHLAFLSCNRRNVDLLLSARADVCIPNSRGDTALHLMNHRTEGSTCNRIIKFILSSGGSVNLQNKYGMSALHFSSINGRNDVISTLASSGANINSRDMHGATPLHLAVVHNKSRIVDLLLTKGADINVQNENGNTPLHFALLEGYKTITKLLTSKGADLNLPNEAGNTPLHFASQKCNYINIVHLLISRGGNLNVKNQNGDTPIHVALQQGVTETADLLIAKGANLNSANKYGDTPLHLALQGGYKDTARAVVTKGGNINAVNNIGDTPLHLALRIRYKEMVSLLIASGVDLNTPDKDGNTPLHLAFQQGCKVMAYLLIAEGALVNVRNKEGVTALHSALQQNYKHLSDLLVSKMTDVCTTDKSGDTPLHITLNEGYKDTATLLINKGVNVNVANGYGDTPLHLAARKGYEDVVKLLIIKGADANVANADGDTLLHVVLSVPQQERYENTAMLLITNGTDVNAKNKKCDTLLHLAAANRYQNIVNLLINKGALVNARNINGDTPIHRASRYGCQCIANLLIANQADANIKNINGDGPIHTASQFGSSDIVKLLAPRVDINDTNLNGDTPLYLALLNHHNDAVTFLITNGAEINATNKEGNTLLHAAARWNQNESIADLLIDKGVDLNAENKTGDTPLHEAARYNSKTIANLLITKGALINAKNKNKDTPLHLAVWYRHEETANLLINKGSNIGAKNRNGDTPIHQASRQRSPNVIKELLLKGGEINAENNSGETSLHTAVQYGFVDVVNLLISEGADINAKNKNGDTALDMATWYCYKDIVDILKQKGAHVEANHLARDCKFCRLTCQ